LRRIYGWAIDVANCHVSVSVSVAVAPCNSVRLRASAFHDPGATVPKLNGDPTVGNDQLPTIGGLVVGVNGVTAAPAAIEHVAKCTVVSTLVVFVKMYASIGAGRSGCKFIAKTIE
jgi:hypothetical protein